MVVNKIKIVFILPHTSQEYLLIEITNFSFNIIICFFNTSAVQSDTDLPFLVNTIPQRKTNMVGFFSIFYNLGIFGIFVWPVRNR